MVELPWSKHSKDSLDLSQARFVYKIVYTIFHVIYYSIADLRNVYYAYMILLW